MPVIDERGRLFGRVNLIDAAAAVLLLVLLPIAYSAYRLFRPPRIEIHSLTPGRVTQGDAARLEIKGANLRPYLRAQVGHTQPRRFLIETPSQGEMVIPSDMEPGTYDFTMYDENQQVAALKNALTIVPVKRPSTASVQLVGVFFGLDEAAARTVAAGRMFPGQDGPIHVLEATPPRGDVRHVRTTAGGSAPVTIPVPDSWQVGATLRAPCAAGADGAQCQVNDLAALPGTTLPLASGFSFAIEDVRPDAPGVPVDLTVQFSGRPEVIDLMRAGDVDLLPGGGSVAARIVSLGARRTATGEMTRQPPSAAVIETLRAPVAVAMLDVEVHLVAAETPLGFSYRSATIRPGDAFAFQTPRYAVWGTVVRSAAVSRR